jgi:regulator of RNase E activity RraA
MTSAADLLQSFSTPTVSDSLDRLGIPGQCLGIKPLDRIFKVCGPCFTLDYEPVSAASGNNTVGDYIDDVAAGQVVLIANNGRLDCTVWGDILTLAATKRGVGGTVIDGVCRDSEASLVHDYPLFAVDHTMRTGKGRVALRGIQKPIKFRGITVTPGDIVIGDADGVVIVPQTHVREVTNISREIEKTENRIRQAVLEGKPLKEARQKFGYFKIRAAGKTK